MGWVITTNQTFIVVYLMVNTATEHLMVYTTMVVVPLAYFWAKLSLAGLLIMVVYFGPMVNHCIRQVFFVPLSRVKTIDPKVRSTLIFGIHDQLFMVNGCLWIYGSIIKCS